MKVRYARLKNLGNYENERVEVEIECDDFEEGLEEARYLVNSALDLLPNPAEIKAAKDILKQAGEL